MPLYIVFEPVYDQTRPDRLLRLLCPLQHFENAGEFLSFFNVLRFYLIIPGLTCQEPSALGLVHSVYCCHFSPFCTSFKAEFAQFIQV